MNLKKSLLVFGFPLMMAVALPLCAQSGCVDSPEDPTLALALVSCAGVLTASLWKFRQKDD